jgi:hypothetical protein
MRRPIEALARELSKETDLSVTAGDMADKHRETPERIMDAWQVLKILEITDMLDEKPLTYIGGSHV